MSQYYEGFLDEIVRCGCCGAEQDFVEANIGILGMNRHLRCRHCGVVWCVPLEEVPAWLEE